MCVILYKPANTKMPSHATLSDCWWTNPDGAGYMFPDMNGSVIIRKGYMSKSGLMDSLDTYDEEFLYKTPIVMHFRIGTQGNNDAANTHPFAITSNEEILGARKSVVPRALVHNGMIPLTMSYSKKGKETKSDTFYFVRDYASLICNSVMWREDSDKHKLLESLAESKLAIMDGYGNVDMIGKFTFDESDGCWYSNQNHEFRYTRWGSEYSGGYSSGTGVWVTYDAEKDALEAKDQSYYDDMYTDYLNDANKRTHVSAAFLPKDMMILNENTGNIVDASYALFVVDGIGQVYTYNDDTNKVVRLSGWTMVDENLEPSYPNKDEMVQFEIYEYKTTAP